MRVGRLILFLFLTLGLTGCLTGEMGGTDTGPAKSPDGAPQTEAPSGAIKLFSKQGEKDANWIDTDQNSLNIADFTSYQRVNDEVVFATDPIDESLEEFYNVHSHYFSEESDHWKNYTFRGRVKISEDPASTGITFLSQYPYERSYYRLRRHLPAQEDKVRFKPEFHLTFPGGGGWDSKHLCKTADGETEGRWNTNVDPVANVWYHFEIEVKAHADSTEIKAKMWPEVLPKPREYQVHCFDFRPERLSTGTVGIWHGVMDTNRYIDAGEKYFDQFSVEFND